MDRPSEQRRQGDRRLLWDRRSPEARRSGRDQRTGERRVNQRPDVPGRRSRSDRRQVDRRGVPDRRSPVARRREQRRRQTPTPYSARDLAVLRTGFAAPGPVSCPACGGRVAFDPAERGSTGGARGVVCHGCGRAAMVPRAWAARVLVTAKDPALRNLLRDILAGAGHEVVETDDTSVALAACGAAPADVVILDVLSPGRMPVKEFNRQLRSSYPNAHIVALAGRSSYAGVDPLMAVPGMEGVRSIRVPISREALLKTVEEARA